MKTLLSGSLTVLFAACSAAQPRPATGPLRVLPANPHWFADPSGKAVLLAGSHVWQNLQDNGLIIRGAVANPPPVFDYPGYLDFLNRHGHNFFRLWRWETTRWTDRYTGNEDQIRAAASVASDRTGRGRRRGAEVRPDALQPRILQPATLPRYCRTRPRDLCRRHAF